MKKFIPKKKMTYTSEPKLNKSFTPYIEYDAMVEFMELCKNNGITAPQFLRIKIISTIKKGRVETYTPKRLYRQEMGNTLTIPLTAEHYEQFKALCGNEQTRKDVIKGFIYECLDRRSLL